ncbi:hypothetical protein M9Y10_044847 [Tritrichomonas musculus]|uniref:Uncharacterized protein n=1 Tax=Tritrichomonas musculus TaxID=1915356 RepID=A0ABR2JTJ1_9EUKA
MISLNDFLGSYYFTAVEIFVVCMSAQLILQVVKYSNDHPNGLISRKNNAVFYRVRFWRKFINRYSRPAIDIRRSWALKTSEKRMQMEPAIPDNPFMVFLPQLASIGPNLFASFLVGDKPALRLPFIIPPVLRPLLQMNLKPELDADNHIVSGFGLFIILTGCQYVFIQILPMANKLKRFFTARDNLKQYANFLVTEEHHWELENAEDELLAMIDEKLKNH